MLLENITADQYRAAIPFPHCEVQGFFPDDLALEIERDFPRPESDWWSQHGRLFVHGAQASKLECSKYSAFPDSIKRALDLVSSEEFISQLELLTGHQDLVYDHSLYGGGLNSVSNGGRLRNHADFNFNSELGMYRTLNLLVYFNRYWSKDYGGCLEMYDSRQPELRNTMIPGWNHALIFDTNNTSIHGYESVTHPLGVARRSLNIYYYLKQPAAGRDTQPHKTIWRDE